MQVLARSSSRKAAPFLVSIALLGVALGCGGGGGDGPGMQVLHFGAEALVIVPDGNLASASPTTDGGRVAALAQYVREHLDLFGPGVDPAGLVLEEAATQEQVRGASGEVHALLALRQVHMGAPIIDEFVMGAFHQGASGGELRRVRGRVRGSDDLPAPPNPATHGPGRIAPAVTMLVDDYGLSADRIQVGATPVISAVHGVAGYLVSQFQSAEGGAFQEFSAVVDPRDLRIVVIVNKPPCEATEPFLPAVAFAPSTPSVFEIPPGLSFRTVRIHAVRLSDFGGGRPAPITRSQVKRWVDEANSVWLPQAGLFFAFDDTGSDDFEALESTLLNTVPPEGDEHTAWVYKSAGNIWSLLFHHDKLVVYFREGGGPGWSWGPTSTFFVSMPSWTQTWINKPLDGGSLPNETLLSHELGHYFGLAHTFSGAKCVDAVPNNSDGDLDGQDGNTSDDDVLDTLPDMSDACFATDSLSCTGGIVIYNGQLWNPPWENVMSYHDCLPEAFTPHQVAAINRALQHPVRAGLLK